MGDAVLRIQNYSILYRYAMCRTAETIYAHVNGDRIKGKGWKYLKKVKERVVSLGKCSVGRNWVIEDRNAYWG